MKSGGGPTRSGAPIKRNFKLGEDHPGRTRGTVLVHVDKGTKERECKQSSPQRMEHEGNEGGATDPALKLLGGYLDRLIAETDSNKVERIGGCHEAKKFLRRRTVGGELRKE